MSNNENNPQLTPQPAPSQQTISPQQTSIPQAKPVSPQLPQSITVSCPQCGTKNMIHPSHVGIQVACACCGYRFVVYPVAQITYAHVAVAQPPGQPPLPYQVPSQYPYPPMPPQPYYPYYPQFVPQYPMKPRYSWEMYARFYKPLERKKKPVSQTELKAGSFFLLSAAILALVAIFMFALSPVLLDFGGNAALTGKVTENGVTVFGFSLGVAIDNASVTLDNSSTIYTNSNGQYSFNNIQSGDHFIEFSKNGYNTTEVEIFVIKGISDKLNIVMGKGSENVVSDQRLFSDWQDAYTYFYGQTILLLVLSLFMFAGAYFAYHMKHFGVAFVGSILGIAMIIFNVPNFFVMNIILGIGTIFGVIASAFFIKNRKYFLNYDM